MGNSRRPYLSQDSHCDVFSAQLQPSAKIVGQNIQDMEDKEEGQGMMASQGQTRC